MRSTFKNCAVDIVQPLLFSALGIHDLFELQSLVRLYIGLVHNKHKFNRNLCGFRNLLCSCNLDQELAFLVLFHCHSL